MEDCLIVCTLGDPPPGALPPWGGLVDSAEEQGLFWFRPDGEHLRRLPVGLLWGRFDDPSCALQAFDDAVAGASDLLGYPIPVERRMVRLDGSGPPKLIAAALLVSPPLRPGT